MRASKNSIKQISQPHPKRSIQCGWKGLAQSKKSFTPLSNAQTSPSTSWTFHNCAMSFPSSLSARTTTSLEHPWCISCNPADPLSWNTSARGQLHLTSTVATHCLLRAVVTQRTRRYGLKVILEKDVGDDSTGVCYQQEGYEEWQRKTGQGRQSCTM